MMGQQIFDGEKELESALELLAIDLAKLIAATGLWVPKSVLMSDEPVYPNVRRGRHNEKKGSKVQGCRIDDNTYANQAIKSALGGRKKFKNYAVCHVWPDTCYNPQYHTHLANLVLIPKAIAGLSDHNSHIIKCLQYRAWELFQWHPKEFTSPSRPDRYPNTWKNPVEPDFTRCEIPKEKSSAKNNGEILPIILMPSSEDDFKKAFLKKRRARIETIYSDGRIKTTWWVVKKFTEKSGVINNLRSKPEFRAGVWQKTGIKQVLVTVDC